MKVILKIFKKKWYLVLSSLILSYWGFITSVMLMWLSAMFFSEMTGVDSALWLLLLSVSIGTTVGAFVITMPLMPIYQEITKQLGEETAIKTRVIIYLFWWIILAGYFYSMGFSI